MVACAPIIALVEVATSGALSSAIGSALGSQILGGAVLGLVASGGKPEGALFGGLTSALVGGLAGSSAAGGAEAAATDSMAGALADQTVDNMGVGMSAAEFEKAATGVDVDAAWGIAEDGSAAASAGSKAASKATELAAGAGKETAKEAGKGGLGKSIMERATKIEQIAKEYPTITKIGMGALQGVGEAKLQEDLLEKKYELADDLERKQQDRAFRGASTSLGFKPSTSGYQTPLQKYLGSVQS